MNVFKAFEKISELIGWLQIAVSFTIIGALAGLVLFYCKQTLPVLILAIIIALSGLVFGIVFATRMYRGKGTLWFLSRVDASPELDQPEEGRDLS